MDELAVLAIPAGLVTGLVLAGLGIDGRPRAAGPRRWVGRVQDWATQAGGRGGRGWHVVAVCGGAGAAVGVAVAGLTRSLWLGLAFAGLAGWLPLGALRARRRRRLRELREVWPDAIDNLASGVRAGLSLPEAVAGLAERGPEPVREPFRRFAHDLQPPGRGPPARPGPGAPPGTVRPLRRPLPRHRPLRRRPRPAQGRAGRPDRR